MPDENRQRLQSFVSDAVGSGTVALSMVPRFAHAMMPAGTDELQDIGSQGSHAGNAARDFLAYAWRELKLKGLLELYEAPVTIKRNNKAVEGKICMLLPHDLFSALGHRNALDKVIGPHSEHLKLWENYLEANPLWVQDHPISRQFASGSSTPESVYACRLLGDDCRYKSNSELSILMWLS